MFLLFLRFTDRKADAPKLMEGHRAWIAKGFAEGGFLFVGTLKPAAGGVIVAHDTTAESLEALVAEDPFVIEGVVTAEIHEVDPARTDARLDFLAA